MGVGASLRFSTALAASRDSRSASSPGLSTCKKYRLDWTASILIEALVGGLSVVRKTSAGPQFQLSCFA
jgi:hypothetical protein